MTDRLTNAFNALRAGGAVFAGRVRLTNWSDNARGMNASIRLDASTDPLDNPTTHPFKGAHCSPKDGEEFMVLFIPVAREEAKSEPVDTPAPETTPAPAAEPERRKITDLPFSQRAAMLCEDKLFWQFINDRFHVGIVRSGDAAAHFVREHCRVKSRADLNEDHDAAVRFDRLSKAFWQWKNEPVSPAA